MSSMIPIFAALQSVIQKQNKRIAELEHNNEALRAEVAEALPLAEKLKTEEGLLSLSIDELNQATRFIEKYARSK